MWFDMLKEFYTEKRYNDDEMKVFVEAKWIDDNEYETITGSPYIA